MTYTDTARKLNYFDMYKFSERSKKNLSEAHADLQKIAHYAIQYTDFGVIEGHRPKDEQDKAYNSGKSKVKYPNSKHNKKPSMAIDIIPYVANRFVGWPDEKGISTQENIRRHDAWMYMAGIFMGVSEILKDIGVVEHTIRWGHDWDMDDDLSDQTFNDSPHFELVKR